MKNENATIFFLKKPYVVTIIILVYFIHHNQVRWKDKHKCGVYG